MPRNGESNANRYAAQRFGNALSGILTATYNSLLRTFSERSRGMRSNDQLVMLIVVAVLLTMYFTPVWLLDYAILNSDFFRLEAKLIKPLNRSFFSNGAVVQDILTLLTAILTGAGLGYLSRKKTGKRGQVSALVLLGYVGFGLVLLWGTRAFVHSVDPKVFSKVNNPDDFLPMLDWTTTRFRETLALFALALGIKGQEFVTFDEG
jgi:hypothetical protein